MSFITHPVTVYNRATSLSTILLMLSTKRDGYLMTDFRLSYDPTGDQTN